nr:PDZ domain-containing protein [Saprospiraceae bacterium]
MEDSKKSIWIPLFLAIATAFGMIVGYKMNGGSLVNIVNTSADADGNLVPFAQSGKLDQIMGFISSKYIYNDSLDKIQNDAIQAIMGDLDPHSIYISNEEIQGVTEDLEGNFEGIGVEFMNINDTINVITAISGGPSELVGIQSGDKIMMIGDSLVAGKKLENRDIIKKLKGPKGTKVNVMIKRGNQPKLIPFTIIRDKIPMQSVDAAFMLDDKNGYIKINRFAATTYKEFMEHLEVLITKHKMQNLVIDLRQNPGGYLDQAVNILSQLFRDRDRLMVYTKGRKGKRTDFETSGKAFFDIKNISVLIDEGSASASEIVAGAIQDWDRGVIVGRRSFGKGLVQEQFELADGSAVRLTTSKYYTPSGRCIQKSYDDKSHYDDDLSTRFDKGELTDVNIAKKAVGKDTTKYQTASGRVVYGGGGIMPDVFVPIDKGLLQEEALIMRSYISTFAYQYVNKNKATLAKDVDSFQKNFNVDDKVWKELVDFVISKHKTIDKKFDFNK